MEAKLHSDTEFQKDSHRETPNRKATYKLKAVSVSEKGWDFNNPLGCAGFGKPLVSAFWLDKYFNSLLKWKESREGAKTISRSGTVEISLWWDTSASGRQISQCFWRLAYKKDTNSWKIILYLITLPNCHTNSNWFHLVFLEGPETTAFPTTSESGNRCDLYLPPADLQSNFTHVPPHSWPTRLLLISMALTALLSDPPAALCRSASSL